MVPLVLGALDGAPGGRSARLCPWSSDSFSTEEREEEDKEREYFVYLSVGLLWFVLNLWRDGNFPFVFCQREPKFDQDAHVLSDGVF